MNNMAGYSFYFKHSANHFHMLLYLILTKKKKTSEFFVLINRVTYLEIYNEQRVHWCPNSGFQMLNPVLPLLEGSCLR